MSVSACFIEIVGVGGIVAVVIGGAMAASAGRKRQRREWLGEALSSLYSPLNASMELEHRIYDRIRRKANRSELSDEVRQLHLERHRPHLDEVQRLVRENIHYADSEEVRDEALDFLRRMAIRDMEYQAQKKRGEQPEPGPYPDEEQERFRFHALINERFRERTDEFHRLAPPAESIAQRIKRAPSRPRPLQGLQEPAEHKPDDQQQEEPPAHRGRSAEELRDQDQDQRR